MNRRVFGLVSLGLMALSWQAHPAGRGENAGLFLEPVLSGSVGADEPSRRAPASGQSSIPDPVQPSEKDRCPVCGMFVAKHKDFLAEFIFRDGSYAVFDGTKDMFRCYFDVAASLPGKSRADIAAIYVTDYYHLSLIDGTQAFYVVGSDILGPMGKEMIPLSGESEARAFLADHKGRSILKFSDITAEIVRDLD
jgi:copper chaperone NosL